MQTLLNGLAHMSGLRDRDAMDLALVTLISKSGQWPVSEIRLLFAVGALDDQRWLARGRMHASHAAPGPDHAWSDLSRLPKLSDFPSREAAIMTESVVRCGGGPFTTVFPIETQQAICSVLEVESEQALTPVAIAAMESVLWIYQNLQGLLDYGEKDSLTELLNRKSFDRSFHRAAVAQEASAAHGGPDRRQSLAQGTYWLAVIDIDHFKRVNDNFGHLIGDEILLLMAGLMRLNFRLHDRIYRFGGEEFVVLMRCANHGEAAQALERFRAKVEEYNFPKAGSITVSTGFCGLVSDDTPSSAFDRADNAVYYAKEHGRNQVCSYPELVQSGALKELVQEISDADYFF